MKRDPHFLPPRQSVVYGYTRRMLDETGMNLNSFAMAVAENYHRLVATDVQQVPLKLGAGDALIAAMKSNGQVVGRYMKGEVKVLPADLEDAWVLSLPDPYRADCERDLARRRGNFCVRADSAHACAIQNVGKLSVEFGELLGSVSPALADGVYNKADLIHAKEILDKLDDLFSAGLGLRYSITSILPEGDPRRG